MTRLRNHNYFIFLVITLAVIVITVKTMLFGATKLEYFYSIMRMWFTVFFVTFLCNRDISERIINLFYYLLVFNCILVVASFASDMILNTSIQAYVRSITQEQHELLRFGGVFGNFQLPAFLFTIFLLFSSREQLFSVLNMLSAVFFGRLLLLLNSLILLVKFPKLVIYVLLVCLICAYAQFPGYTEIIDILRVYFKERIVPILIMQDYSAMDTMGSYRIFIEHKGFFEIFFGSNISRFSEFGGGDPFYTRWYVGGGVITLFILELVKVSIAWGLAKGRVVTFILVYTVFFAVDAKGDMVTSSAPLLLLLLLLKRKENNGCH